MSDHVRKLAEIAKKQHGISDPVWSILRKPRFLPDEHEPQYWKILTAIAGSIDAEDQWEWILAQDVADQTWEIRRVLRAKDAIFQISFDEALFDLLSKAHPDDPEEKIQQYLAEWHQKPENRERLLASIAGDGLKEDSIAVLALESRLDEWDILSKLNERAMYLRAVALKEIAYHREMVRVLEDTKFERLTKQRAIVNSEGGAV